MFNSVTSFFFGGSNESEQTWLSMTSTECLESFDYSVKPEIVFLTHTVSYNILFNDI
jgi:hypothetical protein